MHVKLQKLNQVLCSLSLRLSSQRLPQVTVLEVPIKTSTLTEPATGLVSAASEMALASTDIVRTIIERGSGSASTELALAMDIVAPRSCGYGDATATHICRSEIPSRIYAKHQYRKESECESTMVIYIPIEKYMYMVITENDTILQEYYITRKYKST